MPHLINLEMYEEQGMIKIGIDVIALRCQCDMLPMLPAQLRIREPTYHYGIDDYNAQKKLVYALSQSHQQSCDAAFISTLSHYIKNNFARLSYTYTLSITPHVAINWLFCLSQYIRHLDGQISFVTYNERKNFDLNAGHLYEKYLHCRFLMDPDITAFAMRLFLVKLSAFKGPRQYRLTLNAIKTLNKDYTAHRRAGYPLPFMNYLQATRHLKIFWPAEIFWQTKILCPPIREEIGRIFSLEHTKMHQYSIVIQFIKDQLRHYDDRYPLDYFLNRREIDYLLKKIELRMKEKLYAKCLGKIARDRGRYNWSYTEWSFIKNAEFTYNIANKTVSIINIQKNLGYENAYAYEKIYFNIYEYEMNCLTSALGLNILPDCNFRKAIIFTPASSKKLIDGGLLFNLKNIKRHLLFYNRLNFFSRARYAHDGKQIGMDALPKELQEKIIRHSVYFRHGF